MGYYIEIREVSLKGRMPEELKGSWKQEGDEILPEEYSVKLNPFEEDLKILAKNGVEGVIEVLGEGGEPAKYVLKNREVVTYGGEIIYPEEIKLYNFSYSYGHRGFLVEINAERSTVERLLKEFLKTNSKNKIEAFLEFIRRRGYHARLVASYVTGILADGFPVLISADEFILL